MVGACGHVGPSPTDLQLHEEFTALMDERKASRTSRRG